MQSIDGDVTRAWWPSDIGPAIVNVTSLAGNRTLAALPEHLTMLYQVGTPHVCRHIREKENTRGVRAAPR